MNNNADSMVFCLKHLFLLIPTLIFNNYYLKIFRIRFFNDTGSRLSLIKKK